MSSERSLELSKASSSPEESAYDQRLDAALNGAETVFARQGFGGASMRDVARAAGMSVAGLYYYLPSKETALYLICDRIFERLESLTRLQSSRRSPEDRLKAFVRGHLGYVLDHRDAYRVLLRDAEALQGEHRRHVFARRRRYFELASNLIREIGNGDARIAPRLAAAALFGMLNWTPTWYRGDLDGPLDELAEDMFALFTRGAVSLGAPLQETG